jgi:hypothetical protein
MKFSWMTIQLFIIASLYLPISGVVIDKSSGYPIQYATIQVENSNAGTISDIKGEFSLSEKYLNKILVISAIGFITERIVAEKEFMRIELKTRVYHLTEAFVSAEREKTDLVIDSHKKDDMFSWFGKRDLLIIFSGLKMDSLRPGPNEGLILGRNHDLTSTKK